MLEASALNGVASAVKAPAALKWGMTLGELFPRLQAKGKPVRHKTREFPQPTPESARVLINSARP
jgi:hypothetical protein